MKPKLSRKKFLITAAATIGSAIFAIFHRKNGTSKQVETSESYLPQVVKPTYSSPPTPTANPEPSLTPTPKPNQTPTPTVASSPTVTVTSTAGPSPTPGEGNSRVIHAHSASATSWNFSTGWYGNYVNQNVVNTMTDEGLKLLTGQSTIGTAWQALLPGYAPGMGIAIKVNFNNAKACDDSDNIIDGLIHPVNALIQGMVAMGVQQQDIWIFDASRNLPNRFRNGCLYTNVRFLGGCAEEATFNSTDPDSEVDFQHANLTNRRVTDVIIDAAYLINMPIIKDHGISGVTLGFKNHFGTIDEIEKSGEDSLHIYINPGESGYNHDYNPMIDIFSNPHIRNKTILTVGDGLYGALGNTNVVPQPWETFNNHASNSLFFSQDPVAIDCVMLDILDAEPGYHPNRPGAQDYLALALQAGMGVFERGNPWGSGYTSIEYLKIEL